MAYLGMTKRIALVVVYLIRIYNSMQWQAAYQFARQKPWIRELLTDDKLSKSDRRQASRWGKRFERVGSVATKKRVFTIKPGDITPDEAKIAAMILKSGYMTRTTHHGRIQETHHYFSSLRQALSQSPQLMSIYQKYGYGTPGKKHRQFMEALYKHDPLLRIRRQHIKYALGAELMAERKQRATSLWARAHREPHFLERIFFVDECAIVFDHEIRKGIHVYCDAHDKGYRYVIPYKKLKANQKIKVRIMAAVNYHTGACFIEFMTGTTKVHRLHNLGEGEQQRVYRVSVVVTVLQGAEDDSAPVKFNHVAAR
jgi:hypothetical protein